MARISTYKYDNDVTDDDSWIGTESGNRLTRQFTASAVAKYLNINAKVNIAGQMSFKWSDTENGGIGTISKTGGGGSGTGLNTLTEIRISVTELNGQNVVEFLKYITTKPILLGQGDQISQFGNYTLDTYTVDPQNPMYYVATLTYIGGNGTIAPQGTQYTLIHFDIQGGDVNLKQNFNLSNQWVINNTTGKAEPSVTLTDNANPPNDIKGSITYTNATTITVDFDENVAGSSILN